MPEYLHAALFSASSNASLLENKNVQNRRRISKEVHTTNCSRYSTNVERINWTELKKCVFFSEGEKMEKDTFGTLHDYINLG